METLNQYNKGGTVWHIPLLFLLTLFTRLPFRSSVLYVWDSVNYAYGVLGFDVLKHRPHPPGYIWYVMLGKGLTWLTGDPNTSLVWLSIVGGILAVLATYALGKSLFGPRDALVSALLLATSPLFWFYNEVALTYTLEAFFAVAVAYAGHRALNGNARWAYVSALVFAVAGGFRQTTLVFMGPLVVYVVKHLPRRHRIGMGVVIITICTAWGLPLINSAGGPIRYLLASSRLASIVDPIPLTFLSHSLLYGLHFVLLLLLGYILGLYTVQGTDQPSWQRTFMLLWLAPGLLVAAFRHMGQPGYVLYALPGILIYAPALLRGALRQLGKSRLTPGPPNTRTLKKQYRITILVFLLVGSMIFLLGATPAIRLQEKHWKLVQTLTYRYPPSRTLVLTDLSWYSGFRHAAYYMPDYHVYGFSVSAVKGPLKLSDSTYVLGWVFRSHKHIDNYDLDPSKHVLNSTLDVPPSITGLLVTDQALLPRQASEGDSGSGTRLSAQRVSSRMAYIALPEGARQIVAVDGRLELRW